ncbi:MAG: DUF3991 and TOPRIM domain-containing protein [Eubacterium sp.]|nr:DUF3991 and TOPRIM domain-containing protein [Eubacterium sp.]
MPYYSEEQIKKARSIDLLTYLQTYEPTELVKLKGNTYCTREHDSLKISNGKWYWWSQGFGGVSALDYLTKVQGLSFMDAMKKLVDDEPNLHKSDTKVCRKPVHDADKRLLLPDRSETNEKITKYLAGRGISKGLIEACIRKGVLFESLPYHNCVFVGVDQNGTARYACYRSTNDQKIMGDVAGSDKRFSFRTNAKGRKLHVFECPIDLLSHLTLTKMQTSKWLTEPMLSLGGVYEPNKDPSKWKLPVALQNMLQDHPEVTSIALHLDNDAAGKSAAWAIEGILRDKYNVSYEPPPRGKDYNDYLMYLTLGYKR